MLRMSVEVTIDAVELPTLAALYRFNVRTMHVTTRGPGGGNPELTLTFGAEDAARRFVEEWLEGGAPTRDG